MSTIEDETVSIGGASTLTRRSDRNAMSAGGNLNVSTMSMRMKSQRKRRANKQHNNNFNAGYVPVEEEILHKSGIRGRKRYFLWCTLILLLIIGLLNSLVSIWLVFILGFSHHGMTSMEMMTSMQGREFLRVLSDAHIINLSFKDEALLGGRFNETLTISAESTSTQQINVMGGASSVTLAGGEITMSADSFMVTDSENRSVSLDMSYMSNLTESGMVTNLYADSVITNEITALEENIHKDLYLESVGNVTIEGVKGVQINSGSDVNIDTDLASVLLQSENMISLGGQEGIFLNISQIPKDLTPGESPLTYKVCLCKSGTLFVVAGGNGASCERRGNKALCQDM